MVVLTALEADPEEVVSARRFVAVGEVVLARGAEDAVSGKDDVLADVAEGKILTDGIEWEAAPAPTAIISSKNMLCGNIMNFMSNGSLESTSRSLQ